MYIIRAKPQFEIACLIMFILAFFAVYCRSLLLCTVVGIYRKKLLDY